MFDVSFEGENKPTAQARFFAATCSRARRSSTAAGLRRARTRPRRAGRTEMLRSGLKIPADYIILYKAIA
jgi:hypothetical protein